MPSSRTTATVRVGLLIWGAVAMINSLVGVLDWNLDVQEAYHATELSAPRPDARTRTGNLPGVPNAGAVKPRPPYRDPRSDHRSLWD